VDDGAADVIFHKQVEDFFFARFGVQIDELVLLAGRGDEVLQDFPLRGIGRRVCATVKVEAASSWVHNSR
jgi:hypothetical protein